MRDSAAYRLRRVASRNAVSGWPARGLSDTGGYAEGAEHDG